MSKTAISRPYRVPSAPDKHPWSVIIDDIPHQLPDGMPSWDYQKDLILSRELNLDSASIRRDTGLGDDARIVISVTCECKESFFRELVWKQEIGNGDDEWFEIQCTLPGKRLTSKIQLHTRLLLDEEVPRDSLTAWRKGSILHEEVHRQPLHGRSPRFPTSEVDFTKVPLIHDEACWFLRIGGVDLNTPLSQGFQLYLNSERREFIEKLRDNDSLVTSVLNADVVRQMLEHALSNPEFDPLDTYEEDSVGIVLKRQYSMIFDDQAIEESRERMKNNRHEVEAKIQGLMQRGGA